MVAAVLGAGGLDPTVVVGGRIHGLGANARLGQGEFLVAEADESDGSFLKLSPTIAVVTTVDAEHLDHYADLDAIRAAFLDLREQGAVLRRRRALPGPAEHPADDPGGGQARDHLRARVQRGPHRAAAGLLRAPPRGSRWCSAAACSARWRSRCPGRHNVLNALAAVAVGLDLELPFDVIAGAARRLPRACSAASRSAGKSAASSWWTTTATTPPRSAPPSPPPRQGSTGASSRCSSPIATRRTQHLRQEFLTAFYQSDVLHHHGHLCGRRGAHSGGTRARPRRGHRRPRPSGRALHERRPRGDRRLPVRIHALRGSCAHPGSR